MVPAEVSLNQIEMRGEEQTEKREEKREKRKEKGIEGRERKKKEKPGGRRAAEAPLPPMPASSLRPHSLQPCEFCD